MKSSKSLSGKSEKFHVSSRTGIDVDHCGLLMSPCKTIAHVFDVAKGNVILFLHGGSTSTYNIMSSINIRFNTIIRKYDNSPGNPVIYHWTGNVFKLSRYLDFQLYSIDFHSMAKESKIITLTTVAVGSIFVSNVNMVAPKTTTQSNMMFFNMLQTADAITIDFSSTQGVLININMGISYVDKKLMHNITIIRSNAYIGIQLKDGEYRFNRIIVEHSSFNKSVMEIVRSNSEVHNLQFVNTSGENGIILNKPSAPYKSIPHSYQTQILAVIENQNYLNAKFDLFSIRDSFISTMISAEDIYPATVEYSIQFKEIHITESNCDNVFTINICSMNILFSIIRNTKVKGNIISFYKGKLSMEKFNFTGNSLTTTSKAIYW